MTTRIRPYIESDIDRLIELLRLNTPRYFALEEATDFEQYLRHKIELYFVVEEDGIILGGGGVHFMDSKKEARIAWDLFHPNAQGRGLGRLLVQHRIDHVKSRSSIDTITVRTSQWAHRFYEKCGFELCFIKKDFWAPGFDLYQMELRLTK